VDEKTWNLMVVTIRRNKFRNEYARRNTFRSEYALCIQVPEKKGLNAGHIIPAVSLARNTQPRGYLQATVRRDGRNLLNTEWSVDLLEISAKVRNGNSRGSKTPT
jgi:hypothetical protein